MFKKKTLIKKLAELPDDAIIVFKVADKFEEIAKANSFSIDKINGVKSNSAYNFNVYLHCDYEINSLA